MDEFYRFGHQLRNLLAGILSVDITGHPYEFLTDASRGAALPITDKLPAQAEDVIHPRTTMTINVFGVGEETIVFPPENVTLRIRRSRPYRAVSGLATIDTEMVELQMSGTSTLLGTLKLRGGAEISEDRLIHGKIIEIAPGRGFPADNFFDVLLEVETDKGVFFNKKPEHMVALIEDISPNFAKTPYQSTTEINLYSRQNPQGAPVAAIVAVAHATA